MAAGFSVKREKLSDFKNFIVKIFNKSSASKNVTKKVFIDALLSVTAINESFYEEISVLEPFGPGNSEPKFVIQDLKVINSKVIMDNHIKTLLLGKDGTKIKAISFNAKNTLLEPYLLAGNKKKLSIVGKMSLNEWQGKKDVEFIVDDISINWLWKKYYLI